MFSRCSFSVFAGTQRPGHQAGLSGLSGAKVRIDSCALPREIDSNVACWVTQPTSVFKTTGHGLTYVHNFGVKKPFELRSICVSVRKKGIK